MRKTFLDITRNKLILLVYVFLFGILSAVSIFVIRDSNFINKSYDEIIDSSLHKIKMMRENRLWVEDIQTATIDHVFHPASSDDVNLERIKKELASSDSNLAKTKSLIVLKNEDSAYRRTEIAWENYKSSRENFVSLANDNKAVAYYKSEEKKAYDSFYKNTNVLSTIIYNNIKTRDGQVDQFVFRSQVKINTLIAVAGILLITLGFLVIRAVKNLKNQQKVLIRKDKALRDSELLYKELFDKSPLPKWVCDRNTLRFYEVNEAAIKLYGYDKNEFLDLSVFDLRLAGEHDQLKELVKEDDFAARRHGTRQHIKKNGETIMVDIAADEINYKGGVALLVAITDVTEKIKSEEILKHKEEFFRTITENSSDIQVITNEEGKITYASPSVYKIFGFTESEFIGKTSKDFWHPDDIPDIKAKITELVAAPGNFVQLQVRCLNSYGIYRWCEARISNQLHNPAIKGFVSNYTDIHERKLAKQKLLESEALYRSLFFSSPLPIFVVDKKTLQYKEVNDTAVELYGYSREEFLNLTVFDIRPQQDQGGLQRILSDGDFSEVENYHIRHKKKNGEEMIVDVILENINYKNKEAILAIARDITTTLALQKELESEKINKQKEITMAMISGQEKERNELGKELHDNVNQILATAKLYLETALSNGAANNHFVETGRDLINSGITEIRKISKALVPPSLGDLTFREALKELVAPIKLTDKKIKLKTAGLDESILCRDLKISIFRIVQEQLNNIMKYAEASEITIQIHQDKNKLQLKVADNGKGFDPSTKRKGIGINNIINRASMFNGKVEIDSSLGNGCRLNVNFELADHEQQQKIFQDNGITRKN